MGSFSSHSLLLGCTFVLFSLASGQGGQGPIVTTTYGRVQGSSKVHQNRNYDEFLGIRFGAPPEGELRWQRPQPPSPWQHIYNATAFRPHCTQLISILYPLIGLSDEDSEDCLFLNVFVPGSVTNTTNKPVMVWYYGGGFLIGTGEWYPGHELALTADVIVVTFNYRVSSLGFLSTGDSASPGNYGLWDGLAVLNWVKDNIASFGGNPGQVTIFGQSAGCSAVGHTMIYHGVAGLFQQAIGHSGGATRAYTRDPRQYANWLAEWMGCPTDDSTLMVECLREEDAFDLDLWALVTPLLRNVTPSWMPSVDRDFVPRDPRESYRQGATANFNILAGRTMHDGAGFVLGNLLGEHDPDLENGIGPSKERLEDFLRGFLSLDFPDFDAILPALLQEYPDIDSDDTLTRTLAATQLITDWRYGSATHQELGYHTRWNGTAYHYVYQYRQSFHQYPSWVNGSHMDDLNSLFGSPYLQWHRHNVIEGDFDDVDHRMRDVLIDYWHNFVYNGDPSIGRPISVTWPKYNQASGQFLRLSAFMTSSSLEAETADHLRRFNFWNRRMYPGLTLNSNSGQEVKGAIDVNNIGLNDVLATLPRLVKLLGLTSDVSLAAQDLLQDILADAFYRIQHKRRRM